MLRECGAPCPVPPVSRSTPLRACSLALDGVVVYKQHAQIRRTAPLLLPQGEHRVLVQGLPGDILPNSVSVAAMAQSPDNATARVTSVAIACSDPRASASGRLSPRTDTDPHYSELRDHIEELEQLEESLGHLQEQRIRNQKRRDWLEGWARNAQAGAAMPCAPASCAQQQAVEGPQDEAPSNNSSECGSSTSAPRKLSAALLAGVGVPASSVHEAAAPATGAEAGRLLSHDHLARVGAFLDFYDQQEELLAERDAVLNRKLRELDAQRELLHRRIDEETGASGSGPAPGHHEVLISVAVGLPEGPEKEKTQAVQVLLRISYVVAGATWRAEYDTRAEPHSRSLGVSYRAVVENSSGEDWRDVPLLSLSTAPRSTAPNCIPELPPTAIRFSDPDPPAAQPQQGRPAPASVVNPAGSASLPPFAQQTPTHGTLTRSRRGSDALETLSVGSIGDATAMGGLAFPDFSRTASPRLQLSEYQGTASASATPLLRPLVPPTPPPAMGQVQQQQQQQQQPHQPQAPPQSQGQQKQGTVSLPLEKAVPVVLLPMAGRCTVPGDGRPVRLNVASLTLEAELTHVLVPRFGDSSHIRAAVRNGPELPIIAGQCSIFVDGEFMCSAELRDATPLERFTLNLGRDQNVSAEYKPLVRTRDASGGWVRKARTTETFARSIVVRNCRKNDITVEVHDQVPCSTDERIRVTLVEPDISRRALPLGAQYQGVKFHAETGEVIWSACIAAGKNIELPLQYTIDWPTSRSLVVE